MAENPEQYRMNPEVKQAWIQAMRSGDYAMGAKRLRQYYGPDDWDSYSALGVLCEVAVKHGIITKPKLKPVVKEEFQLIDNVGYMVDVEQLIYFYDGNALHPSAKVRQWAFPDLAGKILPDIGGLSFREAERNARSDSDFIDAIEAHL